MTSDIVALIDYYERERMLPREQVQEALEHAFVTAFQKMVPGSEAIERIRAHIEKRGDVKIFAELLVVEPENLRDSFNHVPLAAAQTKHPDAQVGDWVEFEVTPKNFNRKGIDTAKQTIMQRLRYAEQGKLYEEFKDRAGDILSGEVSRFDKGDVFISIGKHEARLPAREKISTEDYAVGDRLRFYVLSVEHNSRGTEVVLSRSHPNFVRRLFESEVTEIADGTVEIKGLAREAGQRTKILVSSADPKVDPVGACVGLRGIRIRAITRELNNERLDIIQWSDDIEELVAEAIKPANPITIRINEADRIVEVTVAEEELSKAIGRRGVNARLASRVIGWDIQISEDLSEQEKFESKITDGSSKLHEILEISDEQAEKLFRAGGISLDLVVQMPAEYISQVIEITEEEATSILAKAQANLTENA